jgi:DNA-binding transcriptional regulator YiaG
LGVSRRTVANWEMNETAPSPEALGWLNRENGYMGKM